MKILFILICFVLLFICPPLGWHYLLYRCFVHFSIRGNNMYKYPICNHKNHTAPVIFGRTFILCWRCSGVMIAFFIMGILRLYMSISAGSTQIVFGLAALFPMVFDGIRQYYFRHESTNTRRFITGILFGLGFSLIVFLIY